MEDFSEGDDVIVLTPTGLVEGRIKRVIKNYGFNGARETKFEVVGPRIYTICSKRSLRDKE